MYSTGDQYIVNHRSEHFIGMDNTGIDEETKKLRNARFYKQKNRKLTEDDKERLFEIHYRYDIQKNIHYIDDKTLFFQENGIYAIVDYKKKKIYSLENIKESKEFKQSTKETGLSYISPNRIYEIFGSITKRLGINATVNINFFSNNSDDSIKLIQAFRMITGFTGRIPLSMTVNGEYFPYLACYDGICGFYTILYYPHQSLSPFQG